ncbi:uncharacterized protein LOC121771516 isoform X3 [Salvia splendens]|uniref:uncharacterized protein LOC121771516 isoform X3 n=1 Tax=Salvia splendens TaxID=180675 RepID=UPI001C2702E7|nr:uncharacterized protein LOC121771516 isoform X3 [Salvia splendens]
MAITKIQSPFGPHRFQEIITLTSSSEDFDFINYNIFSRKRNGVKKVSVKLSTPNVKKANLFAARKERIKIPIYSDAENSNYHISQFFRHPSGIEAILNLKALQSCQSLDSNLYRCIKLLNFEVAPVIDLQVTSTAGECLVEMISCKFEGSDAVERQNERFSDIYPPICYAAPING